MSGDESEQGALGAPQVATSRLAMFSVLSGMTCIPGLGVLFGLLALRQISRSQYIVGSNLAWMGIMSSAGSVLMWGIAGSRYLNIESKVDPPVAAFMTAWGTGEAAGEAAAGPGLSPVMHHGRSEELRAEMVKRLGPFQSVGPRQDFKYRVKRNGYLFQDQATATYVLNFQSGAPVTGEFDLGFTGSDLKVIGYRIDTPVLRDFERDGANEAHGEAAPEMSEFGTGLPKIDLHRPKTFSKK